MPQHLSMTTDADVRKPRAPVAIALAAPPPSPAGETVVMRLLPAALRNLLCHRLMPGLRMACAAQVGNDIGLVCIGETALFYLCNNQLSRIDGCDTRRLFAQSRHATASHYPRLRVTLVAIREERRPKQQPPALRAVNTPPPGLGWRADPPRFSAHVQIKRRRRIDLPVAAGADRTD